MAPKKMIIDPDKESGIYTAEMGQPPMDPEMAPPTKKAPPVKTEKRKGAAPRTFAKGGSIDGCAQRGKTRGKYI
jgi:hypothetical protein